MAKFLTRKEIYEIIQRELPEDVYAFSSDPSKFYTTSDDDSFAFALQGAYENLNIINNNFYPQSSDESINDWEEYLFNEIGSAASGLQFRRDRVLTKIRSKKGITKQDIIELVYLVIGSDKIVEILENSGPEGSWTIGFSELGKTTILNGFSFNSSTLSGPDLWLKTAAQLGLTEQQLSDYKKEAYGYTVRIVNYNASPDELSRIEYLLTRYEPARSWHTIVNNATLEDANYDWLLDFSGLSDNTFL